MTTPRRGGGGRRLRFFFCVVFFFFAIVRATTATTKSRRDFDALVVVLNGNAVKPGNVIEHNGRLWTAVKVEHVKPGKGGAFAQIEPKPIATIASSSTGQNSRYL